MTAAENDPNATTQTRREVPFYQPDIGEEEIQAVAETLRSGWLTVGPKTQEFEAAFAACAAVRTRKMPHRRPARAVVDLMHRTRLFCCLVGHVSGSTAHRTSRVA